MASAQRCGEEESPPAPLSRERRPSLRFDCSDREKTREDEAIQPPPDGCVTAERLTEALQNITWPKCTSRQRDPGGLQNITWSACTSRSGRGGQCGVFVEGRKALGLHSSKHHHYHHSSCLLLSSAPQVLFSSFHTSHPHPPFIISRIVIAAIIASIIIITIIPWDLRLQSSQ